MKGQIVIILGFYRSYGLWQLLTSAFFSMKVAIDDKTKQMSTVMLQ